MVKNTEDALSHAREAQTRSAIAVRVYGVELAEVDDKAGRFLAIRFCGLRVGQLDDRTPTNRIWHLPEGSVLKKGEVPDYKDGAEDVLFFDVKQNADIVEETRQAVVLGREVAVAEDLGAGSLGLFASVVATDPRCRPEDREPGVVAREVRVYPDHGVADLRVVDACNKLSANNLGHCTSVTTTTAPHSPPGRTYGGYHVNHPGLGDSDTGTEMVLY
jgi:hypothetical protein